MPDITLWDWVGFGVFIVVMLALDLGVFHRHSRDTTIREAAAWTVVWIVCAMAFNLLVWYRFGDQAAVQFLTGYLVEKSLSMDNVFVFAVIFGYFMVPLKYQYRILFWGILGAVGMRLAFILIGAELISRFHWVMWVFGVFLIYTGIKLALHSDADPDPERNIVLRMARRILPVSRESHGEKFFARENGKWCVTPLFLVLLVIESTDVLFAVDSVPAIFGITKEPYLVFTSNIFAILGLRALYFLLAGVMDMFRYLSYGLSAVLVFVGIKMLLPESWHIPDWASLSIIVTLLGISIVASIVAKRREDRLAALAAANPAALDRTKPGAPEPPGIPPQTDA